ELQVVGGDREARLGERHLQAVDERGEEGPRAVEPAEDGAVVCAERRSGTEPGGEQAPVLRPREHPRDRAQPLEVDPGRGLGTANWTRADLEQRELVDRCEAAEERRQRGVVPDERTGGALGCRREL